MTGTLRISAKSKEIWEDARPHVLAIFMYVTGQPSTKVLENPVGCETSMSWNAAQKAFRLLLAQLQSRDFPVKVQLGVELNGSRRA